MKLNIGCGNTLLDGFINIDNSPTTILSKFPVPILRLFLKCRLINEHQFEFAKKLKTKKKEFLRADCLKLPIPENSVDLCYSSHMIGWCLSYRQLNTFLSEIRRILKPGGIVRLSFFDFDIRIDEFLQHRDTSILFRYVPLGLREFGFREKVKFLFSPNMRGGIVLNSATIVLLLEKHDFRNIQLLRAGETTMDPALVGSLDLYERSEESVYVECLKG